jgi:hypothetical protein
MRACPSTDGDGDDNEPLPIEEGFDKSEPGEA